MSKPVETACFCTVFAEYDCVPHISRVTGDSVVVETFLPGREVVWDLLDAVRDVAEAVRLVRLESIEAGYPIGNVCEVDLSVLTDKQRDTLRIALQRGFYVRPKRTSLEELETDLDVSASAISQRLTVAQRKLLEQMFPMSVDRE